MSVLLGVESSTDACSVALVSAGKMWEDHRVVPRQHNALVLGCIDALLEDAGVGFASIDALAFGRGPGSFTGLRIAAGVIQGLALSRSLPVVGVSTLETLAAGAAHRRPDVPGFVCVLPARPGEVYVGIYQSHDRIVKPLREDGLVRADDFRRPDDVVDDWCIVGSPDAGATLGLSDLDVCDEPHPRASALLGIAVTRWERGEYLSAAEARPVYLQSELPWRKSSA